MSDLPHRELGPWLSGYDAKMSRDEQRASGLSDDTFRPAPDALQLGLSEYKWVPDQSRLRATNDSIRHLPVLEPGTYAQLNRNQFTNKSTRGSGIVEGKDVENDHPQRTADVYREETNQLFELLSFPDLADRQRSAIKDVLIQKSVAAVTSTETHTLIHEVMRKARLDESDLIEEIFSQMDKFEARPINKQRSKAVQLERASLMDEQQFQTNNHRMTAMHLLDKYQYDLRMRALGNFQNEDQYELWLESQNTLRGAIKEFARQLLGFAYDPLLAYDPLDVACILRIISAPPHVALVDNVIR